MIKSEVLGRTKIILPADDLTDIGRNGESPLEIATHINAGKVIYNEVSVNITLLR